MAYLSKYTGPEIDELLGQVEGLTGGGNDYSEQISDLQNNVSEIQQDISDLEDRVSSLEGSGGGGSGTSDGSWAPRTTSVATSSWTSYSGSASNATYSFSWRLTTSSSYTNPIMVWLVTSAGLRYYCDFTASYSGTTLTIQVFSNYQIAGTLYAFGCPAS